MNESSLPSTSELIETLPRFNLDELYSGLSDPRIQRDTHELTNLAKEFELQFKGALGERLGDALDALAHIRKISDTLFAYLYLRQACDAANETIQRASGLAREHWAHASANHLVFFEQEVGREIPEDRYQELLRSDPRVAKHRSYIDAIRRAARHLLSVEVERALALRAPYGASEWSDFLDQREVQTTFTIRTPTLKGEDFWGKRLPLSKIIHLTLEHPKSDVRFEAMRSLNRTLGSEVAPIMARALNVRLGEKLVDDKERGYTHPMEARNLENRVSPEMVAALHEAVCTEGASQAKRYYGLLARELNIPLLRWSDRTAKVGRIAPRRVTWAEAKSIVVNSWEPFSPTLAGLASRMFAAESVDAAVYQGKGSGAFNYSFYLRDQGPRAYTFLNFLSHDRDVMTLAHEFGHGVHGLLAAEAQGPLMMHAPLAYAETASIFGEMLVFDYVLSREKDPRREFQLLMDKSCDFFGTVVRQISFSLFEQRIHSARASGKILVEEFCNYWSEVTQLLYGKPGEVFDYRETDYLWSYVSHFLNPFYVYAYAFGELLTQSLFGARESSGARFEPLYIDLLRAGSTKDAVELLAPFGLNPSDPQFWVAGIRNSVGRWLDRAESLRERELAS